MSRLIVSSSIRRSNRNRVILSVLGIVVVLAIGAFNLRYVSNLFAGPRAISSTDSGGLGNPEQLDRLAGYIGLGIGALMLAASSYGLFSALSYGDGAKHPISKRLARHGDVPVVVSEIENELVMPRWSHGKLHTTANWLVYAPGADFQAMRLPEVAWLYKHMTQRRTYGIPVGKTFAAHIFDSHGQKIEMTAKNERDVEAILEGAVQAAPWAIVGYDKEIEKTWNKNRAAVVEMVNQRRQQALVSEA